MLRGLRVITALLFVAVVGSTDVLAQATGTISGVARDQASGQGIAGVQVMLVGTRHATITNAQGAFLLLNVPAGQHTLRAEVLGYASDETPVTVRAGEATRVEVGLRVSAIALDEVVVSAVTGRAERKRELGTNTASITARDIEAKPITKMADVLVGRTAGVQLQGVAGSVGTSQRIRIRGANSISLSNEPLIYVDGVLFSNTRGGFAVGGQDYSRFNDLSPEDIESMEILKGPAASALYGTAAANGVILITTKRGRAGAAQWRAYAEYGTSKDITDYPANWLPFQVNNTSKPLFTARGNLDVSTTGGQSYVFCPNYAPGSTPNLAAGTCRQDEVLSLVPMKTPGLNPFTTGKRNKYGLSVSGGNEVVTYYMSGDVESETGVISFNTQDRVNLRTNITSRVRDDLNVSINAGYTRSTLWLNANDNNVFSPLINALLATPVVPTQEQREASPPPNRFGTGFGYYLDDIKENLSQQTVDRFIIGAQSHYQPFAWLSVNANVGMDYFGREDGNTVQPGRLPISTSYVQGFRQSQRSSNYIWTANGAAVATYQIHEKLGTATTVGASFTREQFESTYCYGVGIVEGTRSCSATSSLFDVDEDYTEVRTIGLYVQEQINWRDRLIVAASVRGDDNSAFGQDFGIILYPGASVSWVASEEEFFPKVPGLSNLRLRGSIGQSGQRPGVRDAVTLYGPTAATVGGSEVSAVRLYSVGNPKLKPERTTEFEAGFDAGLLQDRIALEFTYFQKRSEDALISRPLPPSYGLTGDLTTTGTIYDNLGSIRNWGTEVAVNARAYSSRHATLNLRLSASTLENRIEELGEGIEPIIFNRGNQQHKEGFATGGFFGRRYRIENPGQQRVLTPADLKMVDDTAVFLGPSLPTNSQSLSADLTLFGNLVTVSALLDRRAGHKQLNYTELFRCGTGYANATAGAARGQCGAVGNAKASNEEQAKFLAQRFGATDADGRLVSTSAGFAEDADFIKLREVAVTFNVPERLSRYSSLLRGASLTLSGRNLATWTDYSGLDPEINETGGGANFTQGEFNTQPPVRYYTVRLNLAF